jgi:hypothetical protein
MGSGPGGRRCSRRSRRSRLSRVGVAAFASVVAFVAFVAPVALVDGCAEFGLAVATAPDAGDAAVAPADGPASDIEGSRVDGAGDATNGASADAACGHAFCADFEAADPVAEWNANHSGVGGTLAIASSAGASGNALRSAIPASAASVTDWAYVVEPFPSAKHLHVELEIRAPAAALALDAVLTIVQVSGQIGSFESGVGIVLRSSGLGVYLAVGDGSSASSDARVDLPRGTWTHVVLDVRFGTPGAVSLVVGGQTAWDAPLTAQLPAAPELRVGVQHYNGATPQVAVLYDTVRVDLLQ